jgi:hypothetical protein
MANMITNSFPKRTGVPFVVWTSVGNGIPQDVRVEVTRGPKAIGSEFITVGLRPDVHTIQGTMAESDLKLPKKWIALNFDFILKYPLNLPRLSR